MSSLFGALAVTAPCVMVTNAGILSFILAAASDYYRVLPTVVGYLSVVTRKVS